MGCEACEGLLAGRKVAKKGREEQGDDRKRSAVIQKWLASNVIYRTVIDTMWHKRLRVAYEQYVGDTRHVGRGAEY